MGLLVGVVLVCLVILLVGVMGWKRRERGHGKPFPQVTNPTFADPVTAVTASTAPAADDDATLRVNQDGVAYEIPMAAPPVTPVLDNAHYVAAPAASHYASPSSVTPGTPDPRVIPEGYAAFRSAGVEEPRVSSLQLETGPKYSVFLDNREAVSEG